MCVGIEGTDGTAFKDFSVRELAADNIEVPAPSGLAVFSTVLSNSLLGKISISPRRW
jgi:hypothetical protein